MRKARYLAPWHRKWVELEGGEESESERVAALAELKGKPAIYHCVSRVVNREFVLGREEKEHFVHLMRLYERFCQVRVLTYCVMSNHFHLQLEVPARPEDGGASWSDEALLAHLAELYSKREMRKIRWELEHYREQGNHGGAEVMRRKYFARMWDLSAYMKVLKQRFTQWFNKKHGRRGTLWEERFKSVLVEGGHAARRVAAYIDLNPVRASLVEDPVDYRWCGYGEAVTGKRAAREGLRLVMFEHLSAVMGEERARADVANWREAVRQYRVILFEDGEEREGDRSRKRKGPTKEAVARTLAAGGELSEAALMACKVRYFVDGLVIGSEEFVNQAYGLTRDYFGAGRQSGARKMRQVGTQLRTMRALQRDAISV